MVDWSRKYVNIRLECQAKQKRKAEDSRKTTLDTSVIKILKFAWKFKQVLMFLQWRSYGCLVKKYLPGFMFSALLIAVNMLFFFFFLCTFLNQFTFCQSFMFILFVQDYFSQDFYWYRTQLLLPFNTACLLLKNLKHSKCSLIVHFDSCFWTRVKYKSSNLYCVLLPSTILNDQFLC